MNTLTTPVVFLIFNRPEETQKVFDAIARARPRQLFIIADGPRARRTGEADLCEKTREIVAAVDWPCDVKTNFSEENLGCARRVSTGLSWVFEQVPSAIILEDDCLPLPEFFTFCEQTLERYQDDERVMCVTGNNFQFGEKRTNDSYYFSCFPHCWGWATWARAWKHYDHDMKVWPGLKRGRWLRDILQNSEGVRFWTKTLDAVFANRIDSWNIRWVLSCWANSGLTILPNENLVTNIGFGVEATNTRGRSPLADMAVKPLTFPLKHPEFVVRDTVLDARTQLLYRVSWHTKVKHVLSRILKK